MILAPSGTQKTTNLGSFFDANLIEFEDDGDKQCTEIIVFFLQYFMLFQQFCFSVVGEYGRVQAHLCIRAKTYLQAYASAADLSMFCGSDSMKT